SLMEQLTGKPRGQRKPVKSRRAAAGGSRARGSTRARARAGKATSRSRPRSRAAEQPTKEELYEQARKHDIPGRTNMSKSPLSRRTPCRDVSWCRTRRQFANGSAPKPSRRLENACSPTASFRLSPTSDTVTEVRRGPRSQLDHRAAPPARAELGSAVRGSKSGDQLRFRHARSPGDLGSLRTLVQLLPRQPLEVV